MVGEEGFEPPTLWSQTRCATKLRYSPIITFKRIEYNRIKDGATRETRTLTPRALAPHASVSTNSTMVANLKKVVELCGIEPQTSSLPAKRSPS
ncbi:hypothetical protein VCHA53O466_40186 [Vibrio chagasii]|nr:hypothetical protein VCHA53O466_40186 [Vibrio chagasii]